MTTGAVQIGTILGRETGFENFSDDLSQLASPGISRVEAAYHKILGWLQSQRILRTDVDEAYMEKALELRGVNKLNPHPSGRRYESPESIYLDIADMKIETPVLIDRHFRLAVSEGMERVPATGRLAILIGTCAERAHAIHLLGPVDRSAIAGKIARTLAALGVEDTEPTLKNCRAMEAQQA